MDLQRTQAFGGRLLELMTGGALTMMIGIGHRTGLFEAAAAGPATSGQLAERAGLDERYVREWLGAMVTGGILEYRAGSGEYVLPAEHAVLLTGASAANVGPAASTLRTLGAVLPAVERCFTEGGGVPYAEYAAVAGDGLGETWRHVYDDHLVDGFLGAVPGLTDRLRSGARVLDLGCGSGHAVNLMAAAFPGSEFFGLDLAPEAIALAEAERERMALRNAEFLVADAALLPTDPGFDVITAFDAIHDQRAPEAVLARVRAALRPGGTFVMVDTNFSSRLERNLDNPHAPLGYAISLLFCVPTTRASGGPALGAVWGRERAMELLTGAGFTEIALLDSPRPQNGIFVAR